MNHYKIILLMMIFIFSPFIQAQENESDKTADFIKKILSETEISGQWFLAYRAGVKEGANFNDFLLKRGYLTFKESFTKNLSTRFTQDISVDREGDGEGDIELRLKYGYLSYELGSIGFFAKPSVEFGLVHRSWLDFEQKINRYRIQGRMFLERFGIIHSADYGITFMSLLGGEVDEDYQKSVSSKYPGKYGSVQFGVYNGGGYHAIEENQNKLVEGRFTVRPIPNILPGLQLSYLIGYGKGNVSSSPDFYFNVGFLSYQSKNAIFSFTYYSGQGNAGGTAINSDGESYGNSGYSFFGELFIPNTAFSIVGRLDHFKAEKSPSSVESQNYIGGVSYHFLKGSKIVLDYDYSCKEGVCNRKTLSFSVEIKF